MDTGSDTWTDGTEGAVGNDGPLLSFRPLKRADFGILGRWLSTPHVAEWWERLETPNDVEREFGPCVDGKDPTRVFVILLGNLEVGVIQTYLLSDNPEYEAAVDVHDAAGVDLFIGEPELLNAGLGRRILGTFVANIGWPAYPSARRYMAGPSERNMRSRRSFEGAGFEFQRLARVPNEPDLEAVMVLERPTECDPPSATQLERSRTELVEPS